MSEQVLTDVVIGAGSGMGAAVAAALAGRGRPLLLADRDADAAARVGETLEGDIEVVACDISDAAARAALVERVPALGAMVLTAGLSPTMAEGRRIFTVNLVATNALVAAFTRTLVPGSVGVCFASCAGHQFPADAAVDALLDDPDSATFLDDLEAIGLADDSGFAYGLSKRGVIRMVQRRAKAWGLVGARLLSLSPGIIDTPMGRLEDENQPMMADMVSASALGREGLADEIAAVVAFLVSDGASFLTGTDVLVDGGAVAAGRFPITA